MLSKDVRALYLGEKFVPVRKWTELYDYLGKTVTITGKTVIYAKPGGKIVPSSMIYDDSTGTNLHIKFLDQNGTFRKGKMVSFFQVNEDIYAGIRIDVRDFNYGYIDSVQGYISGGDFDRGYFLTALAFFKIDDPSVKIK